MKCQYCKNEIESKEELHQEPKKDRQGNIKTTAKGKTMYYNYHKQCFLKKTTEWEQWCNVFDYLVDTYFIKTLPTSLIKQLKDLRKYYDYKLMLDCLQDIEDNLSFNMQDKNFFNDFQKGNYIMAALQNSIDGFYEKQLKREKEQIEFKNNSNFNFLDNSKKKIEEENYDILD